MTHSPYQSKLLRLVIAQYQKGLDRHRRAVRHTRSTAVAAVELGSALALVPLFTIVQASQAAGRRLKQFLPQGGLFRIGASADRLLSFSDFDESALDTQMPAVAVASLSEMAVAERSMVRALRAVGECLSVSQLKLLLKRDEKQQATRPGFLMKSKGGSCVPVDRQITGVASDIETRSLLLVIGYSWVWNGLSANQQIQLQKQIGLFVSSPGQIQKRQPAYTTALTLGRGDGSFTIEKQGTLTRPFRSFWVEVLKAVAWMRRGYGARSLSKLAGGCVQIKGLSRVLSVSPNVAVLSHNKSATDLFKARRPNALKVCDAIGAQTLAQTLEDGSYCLEAEVIAVGYVEHPLETLLKWVDRILVWLEARWQAVKYRLGIEV